MPGLNPKQEDIDQFVAITQATPADASRFLADGVTLEGAIEDYFAAQAAGPTEQDEEDDLDAALAASGEGGAQGGNAGSSGAFTLGGQRAEALPDDWARPRGVPRGAAAGTGGRMATLDDLSREESPRDDDRRRNELFTGGERSGLAVQGPPGAERRDDSRGLVDEILQHAREGGPAVDPDAPPARNPFAGVGHTLGSEDTPSQTIGAGGARSRMPGGFGEDEDEDDEGEEEVVQRRVTFWRDGFSIEDGELYRYDVPANQELLQAIHAGRAPLSLFDVRFDQPLQLVVDQRTHEDYTPPPKKPAKPFSGGGNRLGSAAPEGGSSSTTSAPAPAQAPAPSKPAEFKVDDSKPTTSVQIRLGDGTRLVAKVNLDHTVADIRAFVSAARPDPRPFVLQTTFPSRELPDSETVEEAKLKNAVVVQRFT